MHRQVSRSVLTWFSNNKLRSIKYLLIVVLALVALPSRTFGQNGTVVGTVTDPQGGVVAGVTITITNTDTGLVKTFTTNESGAYVAPDLNIGRYNIKASASGFKVAEQKDLKLQVGDRLRIDFQMAMG